MLQLFMRVYFPLDMFYQVFSFFFFSLTLVLHHDIINFYSDVVMILQIITLVNLSKTPISQ